MAEDGPAADAAADQKKKVPAIPMHSGYEITEDAIKDIAGSNPVSIVILAGTVGSGKTTLLTSFYDLLSDGKFKNHSFSGSLTLFGFERRCHPARVESGRIKADTHRTPLEKNHKILHLRIRDNVTGERTEVFVPDIAGERFRILIDSEEECQNLKLLKKATRLVVFIDGKKLAKIETRHEAISDSLKLVRGILQAGMLLPSCMLQVLISKKDYLRNAEDEKQKEIIDQIKDTFRMHLEDKGHPLSFYATSARSRFSTEAEMLKLFVSWVKPPHVLNTAEVTKINTDEKNNE